MPPKKRKRPSSPSAAGAAADTSIQTISSSNTRSTTTTATIDPTDAPAFLNTTFSTHRASPLYIGAIHPLTEARFHVLSQRLRDLLVGDVVRGIELGLTSDNSDSVLRRAGALEAVSIGWVRLEDLLGRYVDGDGEADTSLESVESALAGPGKRRALQVGLQYEGGEYTALMLPALSDAHGAGEDEAGLGAGMGDEDFLRLPLLLLRMPAPLKAVICGFISRTFDCRISSLSLGTRSLVGALECWLEQNRALGHGVMAKDVMVTLGFYAPSVLREQHQKKTNPENHDEDDEEPRASETSMGLKSIEITIPTTELRRFVKAGAAHEAAPLDDPYSPTKRRRLGGDKDEESWLWRSARVQPFTEALGAYMRHHLALDMFHPAVRVTRVACGGFVLSEARVKLFGVPPVTGEDGRQVRDGLSDGLQAALWTVFGGLVERARVEPVVRSLGVVEV